MIHLLFALTSCISGDDPGFDCADVAIPDASGDPDPCDVAACQSCADECGSACAILESYPPQYACEGGSSWDVYDTCPGWVPPTSAPVATDIVDLGCGEPAAESLVATSSAAGRIDVTHIDYLLGCCPDAVEVDVTTSGGTLSVDYTLVNDLCECACMLDVAYTIADVPAGTWTIVALPTGATASVTVGP